ncbi:unnamed protein product [Absidia cylindrospora]
MGAACQHSMQCAIGIDYLPGHCNKNTSVCGLRKDIPAFYYGAALRPLTLGDHWKEAVAAVVVTGGLATCFLVGHHQAGKLVSGVSGLIEKWQNRDDHQQYLEQQRNCEQQQALNQPGQSISGEDIWNQQHSRKIWWHILPGAQRIARALNLRHDGGDTGIYVALDSRPLDPPPYRGD